jgi:CDGSH-type Zn-finger protein
MNPPTGEQRVTITPCENGPLLVRGDIDLRTQDGEPIEAGRDAVALCRCGRSAIKPFCDGTHKVAKFRAASGSDRDPLRPAEPAA